MNLYLPPVTTHILVNGGDVVGVEHSDFTLARSNGSGSGFSEMFEVHIHSFECRVDHLYEPTSNGWIS